MKDLKELERQFNYLSEVLDFQDINRRARKNTRKIEAVIKECDDGMGRMK